MISISQSQVINLYMLEVIRGRRSDLFRVSSLWPDFQISNLMARLRFRVSKQWLPLISTIWQYRHQIYITWFKIIWKPGHKIETQNLSLAIKLKISKSVRIFKRNWSLTIKLEIWKSGPEIETRFKVCPSTCNLLYLIFTRPLLLIV